MEDCCWSLKDLKREYEKLKSKYSLPSFKEMNEDFEIEKLEERETEILARDIRRAMIEKNSAYLRFIEMFMNPSSSPMLFLALMKNMDNIDKKLVEDLYSKLGKYEILSLRLDNEYDEAKEAEFINKFFKEWQQVKKDFGSLLKFMEDSWDKKGERKEKGYLG